MTAGKHHVTETQYHATRLQNPNSPVIRNRVTRVHNDCSSQRASRTRALSAHRGGDLDVICQVCISCRGVPVTVHSDVSCPPGDQLSSAAKNECPVQKKCNDQKRRGPLGVRPTKKNHWVTVDLATHALVGIGFAPMGLVTLPWSVCLWPSLGLVICQPHGLYLASLPLVSCDPDGLSPCSRGA